METSDISDADIGVVINHLGPDDLHKLYYELALSKEKVQKCEQSAGTHDIDLQARSVLEFWRKDCKEAATRMAILNGLEQCGNAEIKDVLEEKWGIRI